MSVIYNSDCIKGLAKLEQNSVDCCITDPPYNYEFIGHKWDFQEIERRINKVQNSKTLVKYIPYGSGLAGGLQRKIQEISDTELKDILEKYILRYLKRL